MKPTLTPLSHNIILTLDTANSQTTEYSDEAKPIRINLLIYVPTERHDVIFILPEVGVSVLLSLLLGSL